MIRLAIWYLRRREVSVLMNVRIDGGVIQQKTGYGCTYDTVLDNVKYLDRDGEELIIPQGKFKIVSPRKS